MTYETCIPSLTKIVDGEVRSASVEKIGSSYLYRVWFAERTEGFPQHNVIIGCDWRPTIAEALAAVDECMAWAELTEASHGDR